MGVRLIGKNASAYGYPLLIKHLLTSGKRYAPDQEIIYSDRHRYTYKDFSQRVAQLAHTLGDIGVCAGDTVAVFCNGFA